MTLLNIQSQPLLIIVTLLVGTLGAAMGYAVSLPAYLLTGPALFVSILGVLGLRLEIAPLARDFAFLVIGVGIGSTVSAETLQLLLRLPAAFAALAIMLFVTMWCSQWVMQRFFDFDVRSAVLASAPGHLSFVIGLSAQMNVDVLRVTVAQSIRLLSLTLLVPIAAALVGVTISSDVLAGSVTLSWTAFGILLVLGLGAGLILMRLKVPAAILIGAMVVSAVAHAADWVHGGLQPQIASLGFVTIGTLIGTRFSGVNWTSLASAMGAGLVTTVLASGFTLLTAILVAPFLDIGIPTLLAAFAPGGFETMIALGAVLGGNAGFVAACHVARLMILTVLIPIVLKFAIRAS